MTVLSRQEEGKQAGQLIRQLRLQRGWSQSQLGKIIGLSQGYISSVESGTIIPYKNIERFASVFEVSSKIFPLSRRYRPTEVSWKKNERTQFGKVLRQARLKKGWTQSELAVRIGVSVNSILHYETRGHMPPSKETVIKIANVLDVPDETLLREWHTRFCKCIGEDGKLYCPQCRRERNLSEFQRDRSSSTGYQCYCKECREDRRQRKKALNGGGRV